MNFTLTEEQKQVREMARAFVDKEVIPRVREYDRKEEFPMDIVKKMGPLGFLAATVPPEYGGPGLDYISYAILLEEINRGCSTLRTVISVNSSLVSSTILGWGTKEQKEKYLPKLAKGEWLSCYCLTEPDSGSDAASLKTTAQKQNGGWALNGTKMWISNGGVSDVALVLATVDLSKGHRGITAFLVETKCKGFTPKEIKGKMGLKSSSVCEIALENVEVPDENVLGKVGEGFKVAMYALDNGRYSIGAGCVGVAQGCIDASIKYAKERSQFGKPIAGFQLVQEMIAEMTIETEAARLLVYRAGDLKNKGIKNTLETSMAKFYASEVAQRCAYKAIQIHGGYGFVDEFPVERYFRDVRVTTLYEGTSEIQKLIIGNHLLGIKAFT